LTGTDCHNISRRSSGFFDKVSWFSPSVRVSRLDTLTIEVMENEC
jgi:hypothetical protein